MLPVHLHLKIQPHMHLEHGEGTAADGGRRLRCKLTAKSCQHRTQFDRPRNPTRSSSYPSKTGPHGLRRCHYRPGLWICFREGGAPGHVHRGTTTRPHLLACRRPNMNPPCGPRIRSRARQTCLMEGSSDDATRGRGISGWADGTTTHPSGRACLLRDHVKS